VSFVGIQSIKGNASINNIEKVGVGFTRGGFFDLGPGGGTVAINNNVKDILAGSGINLLSFDAGLDDTSRIDTRPPSQLPQLSSVKEGLNWFALLTKNIGTSKVNKPFLTTENLYLAYRATVRLLYQTLLGYSRERLSEEGGVSPEEARWADFYMDQQRGKSFQLVRTFLFKPVGVRSGVPRDFFQHFFTGFYASNPRFKPANANQLITQARRDGRQLATIARSAGLRLNNAQLVNSWISRILVKPAVQAGAVVESPAVRNDLRLRAINLLNAGGTWLQALEVIVNSPAFIRTAIRVAQKVDPDASFFQSAITIP
jgi:hypothetical protein